MHGIAEPRLAGMAPAFDPSCDQRPALLGDRFRRRGRGRVNGLTEVGVGVVERGDRAIAVAGVVGGGAAGEVARLDAAAWGESAAAGSVPAAGAGGEVHTTVAVPPEAETVLNAPQVFVLDTAAPKASQSLPDPTV